jgi:hypothetical protein
MVLMPTMTRDKLRPVKHAVFRFLGMRPLQKVIKRIENCNHVLANMVALEVFGGVGDGHLRDYASLVQSLTIWEIDQRACDILAKRFPPAEVKCVDSYDEVAKCSTCFDLVVVDSPMQEEGGHFEHFDLLPRVGNILNANAVLVISVLPVLKDRYAPGIPGCIILSICRREVPFTTWRTRFLLGRRRCTGLTPIACARRAGDSLGGSSSRGMIWSRTLRMRSDGAPA